MGLKSSHWSCLKAWFTGYLFCFTTVSVRHLLEHIKAMNKPQKNVQMTLKDQNFVNKFEVLFVCHPEDVWLRYVSEVTLVPKNIFFLKILNFLQSFVECKVSLADGMLMSIKTMLLEDAL
jgi:hypothetical protein